jgi:hypothetical protein
LIGGRPFFIPNRALPSGIEGAGTVAMQATAAETSVIAVPHGLNGSGILQRYRQTDRSVNGKCNRYCRTIVLVIVAM